MVKLTPELIEQSAQYTNPVRDRELDLRGLFSHLSVYAWTPTGLGQVTRTRDP